MTDPLTKVLNRRAFFKCGDEELHRSKRYHNPLSFVMIDIDHFKRINDTYGHDVGDKVICVVAEILTKSIRDVDVVARLGGEEFVVMTPNTDLNTAIEMAERLRVAVENTPCLGKEMNMRVTVSIGVAAIGENTEEIESVLKDADVAMYQAKNQGRNRVVSMNSTVIA